MEQAIIQLRFQTENNSINADTLVKVMSNYVKIMKEANHEIHMIPLIIDVNSFSKGSFIVDFAIKVKDEFNKSPIATIVGVATLIGLALSSNQQTNIGVLTNIDNTNIITNNIIINKIQENNTINKNKINIYKTILRDGDIHGLDIYVDGSLKDSISKEEMIKALEHTTRDRHLEKENFRTAIEITYNSERTVRVVSKPDNICGEWTFTFEGVIIKANATDQTENLDQTKSIDKGDIIRIKMKQINEKSENIIMGFY